ncbi:tetraketide alpha-pyrone reductase 1-like protein [Tanacetum coccineum]
MTNKGFPNGEFLISSWRLAFGYSVHATVRSLGMRCVFHTTSPVQLIVDDPQAQLIDPAVKGTLNVLKSTSKVPSLKRVILTSSMATVSYGAKVPVFGDVVDETWSSDLIVCQKIISVGKPAYSYSFRTLRMIFPYERIREASERKTISGHVQEKDVKRANISLMCSIYLIEGCMNKNVSSPN